MSWAEGVQLGLTGGLLLATGFSAWAAVQQRGISKRLADLEERREERRVEIVRIAKRLAIPRGSRFDADIDWVEVTVANPTGNRCVITGVQDRQWATHEGWFGSGSEFGSLWVEADEGEESIDGLATRDHLAIMPGHVGRLFVQANIHRQTLRMGLMVYLTGPSLEEALEWTYLTNPIYDEAEAAGLPLPALPDPLEYEVLMDAWSRAYPDERRRLREEGQPLPPDEELDEWEPTVVAEFVNE